MWYLQGDLCLQRCKSHWLSRGVFLKRLLGAITIQWKYKLFLSIYGVRRAPIPVWVDRILLINGSSIGYAFWSCFVFPLVSIPPTGVHILPPLFLSLSPPPLCTFSLWRVGHRSLRLSPLFKPTSQLSAASLTPSGWALWNGLHALFYRLLCFPECPTFLCHRPLPYCGTAAVQLAPVYSLDSRMHVCHPSVKYSCHVSKQHLYGQVRWFNG